MIGNQSAQGEASSPLRLAYLILAHKNPEQLIQLMRRLDAHGRTFVVHVDRSSSGPEWEAAFKKLASSRVHWAKRVDCVWGDFTLVEATLNCIHTLVSLKSHFDHVVLLSGQDYPIKSNQAIETYLKERRGKNLMYFYPFPYPEWAWSGYDRLPTWRLNILGRPRRIVPVRFSRFLYPTIPGGLHPCGGSQWWCLTGEAVNYIDEFVRLQPKFVEYFRKVFIPDELFFHTILGNSPFQPETGSKSPHFMRWSGGPNPETLSERDLPLLRASGKLFARKFDIEATPEILRRIDEELSLEAVA